MPSALIQTFGPSACDISDKRKRRAGSGLHQRGTNMWRSCSRLTGGSKVETRSEPHPFFMLVGKTNKASFWNIIHVNLEICSCHLPGCWNSLKDPWPRGLRPHVVPLDHVKESCCVSRLSLPLKGELLGSICWMWCMAALTNTSTVTHWCK